ncbi:MAG TPA: hypothetical protein VKJ07_02705, partial [Mycobacteriales bacterium]|nr:hypothetical protein [Mycobacteriales bacterium]
TDFATSLELSDVMVRTPDRTSVLARARCEGVPTQRDQRAYVIDVPVRRLTELAAVLTVRANRPLTDSDATLVNGLAATVALAVAADPTAAAWSAARAILDEEADRAQAAATLYDGLGDALVAIRYAAELVSGGRAGVGALDEPVRAALMAFHHAHRDGQAHALTVGLRAALRQLPARFAGDRLDDGMPELRLNVIADDVELDELPPSIAVLVQRIAEVVLRGAVGQASLRATSDGSGVKLWVGSAEIAYDASELSRWSRRASALGGDLAVRSGGVELDLPIPP